MSTSWDTALSLAGDTLETLSGSIIELAVRRGICALRSNPQPLSFKLSTHTPEAPVRGRFFLAGLVVIAAACSRPDAGPVIDEAQDERSATPNLALTAPTGAVPVASDLEVHQPEPAVRPQLRVPTPRPESTREPVPEPLASDRDGDLDAAPASGATPMPVASHVHPKADPDDAVSGPAEQGGGKPQGVNTGLGPVPDRNWGDTGIIDDPNPLPDPMGTGHTGMVGRDGVVIIRGGAGGMHDDCKIHPGGNVTVPMRPQGGPEALVNDRDPRRGAAINERAPRTARSPSLPRGGGFPRGGIR
jgi:hypothetical protein